MEIEIKYFDEALKEKYGLEYKTVGSAAFDVRACIRTPERIMPGGVYMVPLGFAMHIADVDVAAILLPRSGIGSKEGVVLGNTIGLIDSDYQSQVFAAIMNRNKREEILIKPYDRIAQMMIVPVIQAKFKAVEKFTALTKRGGFGSTGKN